MSAAMQALGQGRYSEVETLCRRICRRFRIISTPRTCSACARIWRAARGGATIARARDRARSAFARCSWNLGAVYFNLQKFQDARACQEKAIALKPNSPIASTNLGNTLLHMGLAEQAIELHDRAIRLKPDYADAFCNRGMAELIEGQFLRAKESFDRALAFQPRHAEAIAARAWCASSSGTTKKRPQLSRQGSRSSRIRRRLWRSADGSISISRGWSRRSRTSMRRWRFHRGSRWPCRERRKSTFSRATRPRRLRRSTLLEENPRSDIGVALLASCYASQGDIATALEHLDAALAIAPDYAD